MASRRMISSDIWRDEFIGEQSIFGRLLWVGMIVTVADDQGRMPDNPKLIRSDVFPMDDISLTDIEECLTTFAKANKVLRYEAGGKKLIQILNWWEYQTPSWASASKFEPPKGWVDREKYHSVGNKIVTKDWDKPGGFTKLHSGLGSGLGSGLNEGESEGEGKGDGNGKGEGDGNEPPAPPLGAKPEIVLVHEVTGLYPDLGTEPKVINNVQSCRKRLGYPPREKVLEELQVKWETWKNTTTPDGKPYNPGNWAWTEWAATGYAPATTNGGKPAARALTAEERRLESLRKLQEKYAGAQ